MNSYILSRMTWSFSRISSYENCPYQFFLKYILLNEDRKGFFSSYGSFVHGLAEKYYSGSISREEAVYQYLSGFSSNVCGTPPSINIYSNYFQQGLAYFRNIGPCGGKVLGLEKHVQFNVDGYPFVGYVDMVLEDEKGVLKIVDHKSRALRARSGKKKPTAYDKELDQYLRQLYLYSIPIKEMYGRWPNKLVFNCYRTGNVIEEKFLHSEMLSAMEWAKGTIEQIKRDQKWKPSIDYWKCRHLCGVSHECDYWKLTGGESNDNRRY